MLSLIGCKFVELRLFCVNLLIETVDNDEVLIHNRFPQDCLPVENRLNTFDEVLLGYHKLNAIAEAMRCLHCDRR